MALCPNHWTEVDGELVFDSIRDEMREPLALLNRWYRDGVFREDFFTINHVGLDSGRGCESVRHTLHTFVGSVAGYSAQRS